VTLWGKVGVSASIPPLAWIAERVGGEHVEVWAVLEAGQDPHSFEAKPSQVRRFQDAEVFFTVGMPFERFLSDKVKGAFPSIRIVDTSENIEKIAGGCTACSEGEKHAHAHGDSGYDPHVWLDPLRGIEIAASVRDALIALDPDNASDYRVGFAEVSAQLSDLDRLLTDWFKPLEGMSFYVYHPAFAYFAHRYGLEERAIEREGKAPGPRELARLMDEAKGTHVLFAQPQFDDKAVRMLADAIGAEVEVLNPLERDYAKNLQFIGARIMTALRMEKVHE